MRSFILLAVLVISASGTAPLLHVDSANVNPGVYLVVLNDGLKISERDNHVSALLNAISTSAAPHDSEVLSLFSIANLIGFSARLSPQLLQYERSHPNVKYIEPDQVVSINYNQLPPTPRQHYPRSVNAFGVQTGAPWGLDRIDQRSLPLDGRYQFNSSGGAGVDVYVIDTGILTTHQEFGGRAVLAYNAVVLESGEDMNGHGTHCAGIIAGATYGVAKMAHLYAVKVLNARGSGTTQGVVNGINFVTNNRNTSRSTVASMSLGGGASTTLDDAVTQSINSGVVFSVAAGNSAADACNTSPARVASAITVGATNTSDYRASYSNYGSCVTVFAPGSSITSAWIGSSTATNTISGTSMATPHVSGAIALHLSSTDPTLTPATTKAWLTSVATNGVILDVGVESPNLLLYTPFNE